MKSFNNTRLEIRYILDHLINAVQPHDLEGIFKLPAAENDKNVSAYYVAYNNDTNDEKVIYVVLRQITKKFYMTTFTNGTEAADFYLKQIGK